MNIPATILRWMGWKVIVSVPDYPKCIICVAPHTSNMDFIIGKPAYSSIGREAGFLMKSSWFFPPLGWFFKSIGGVPVERKKKHNSLVETLVERFRQTPKMAIAVTPEGTRSRNPKWRTGFLEIARQAEIPIVLAKLDYGTKTASITDVFYPTGNVENDMNAIKNAYRGVTAKFPENFAI